MTALFSPSAAVGLIPSEFRGESAWINDFGNGRISSSSSGLDVSPNRALGIAEVFACVRAISEDAAKLPLDVFRRLPDEGKEKATDLPLFRTLHLEPNPEVGSFMFRQALLTAALVWGNGYAEVEYNGDGTVRYLWLLEPWRVTPRRTDGGDLFYEIKPQQGGASETLSAWEILHVQGFSVNGLVGYLPTRAGAETMGLAMAAKMFTASFFRNGTSQRGIITTPNKLTPESLSAYRDQINKIYGGAENAHGWMAFDNGATVSSMDVDPNKAQLIQTMYFAVEDVARFFRVPPHKIQHLLRATFSNIEHQAIEYVGDTILPWLVKFEQEYTRKLLNPNEQKTLFVEHNLDVLLRADLKTRYEAYAIGINTGFINRNEVRAKENMNAYTGGDRYLVQQNVAIVNDEGGIEPTNKPTEPAGQGAAPVMTPEKKENGATAMDVLKVHMMPVFVDAAERMIAREVKAIKKNGTAEWLEKFYAGHEPEVAAAFRAPIASLARAAGVEPGTLAERYAARHCAASRAGMADIEKWMGERPAEIARTLTDEVCHENRN